MMPGKHFPQLHTTLPWSRGLVSPARSLHIGMRLHIRANTAGCVLLLIISLQLSALSRRRATGGRLLWVNYSVKLLLIPCQRVDEWRSLPLRSLNNPCFFKFLCSSWLIMMRSLDLISHKCIKTPPACFLLPGFSKWALHDNRLQNN